MEKLHRFFYSEILSVLLVFLILCLILLILVLIILLILVVIFHCETLSLIFLNSRFIDIMRRLHPLILIDKNF